MVAPTKDLREAAAGWRWGKRPLIPRSAEPFALHEEPEEFPTSWARTPHAEATDSSDVPS